MKKIFIFLFLTVFAILAITPNVYANDFRMEYISRDTSFYDGIRHIRIEANVSLAGETKSQHMNYIAINTQKTDYKLISSDGYSPYTFSMMPLTTHVDQAQQRYPNLHIAGGVNADFYDINNTGRPSNIHIQNFEVINKGSSTQRAAGFLDDGDIVFGTPKFLGQHLNILNEDKELKQRIKISKVNTLPTNEIELAVFYDAYKEAIPAGYPKVVIKSSDIKVVGSTVHYAKGEMISQTTDAVTLNEREFVLVGRALQDVNLVTDKDTIIIQELLGNGFENARFGVGLGDELVKNGTVNSTLTHSSASTRHPRTAIGQMEDGTVFFLVVDGRDVISGRNGLKMLELANVMKSLGAKHAYNIDGGGSSTMLLRDQETNQLNTINVLSDGRMRSISNGILIAKGGFEPVFMPIPYPETRSKYDAPTGVYVDDEGILHFLGNNENAHYTLKINGREVYLNKDTHPLLLAPGNYEIQVKTKGSGTNKSSDYSETFTYNVHKEDIKQILELFKNMA